MNAPTRSAGLPPALFEHEVGSWEWSVGDGNEKYPREVNVYVLTPTAVVCVEAGHDAIELNEPRVRGLIVSLWSAYARLWGDPPT